MNAVTKFLKQHDIQLKLASGMGESGSQELDLETFADVEAIHDAMQWHVHYVARGGIEAVGRPMRRSARSLGMSYWQDMRYVVLPIGGRAIFPSWIGVALGVMKDSALVSVLGYVELLKASQILITRTQEPFLILSIAGAFYFALSFPISRYAAKLEERWAQ